MGHEELKQIGVNAYGHRHKLIKGQPLEMANPVCVLSYFVLVKNHLHEYSSWHV